MKMLKVGRPVEVVDPARVNVLLPGSVYDRLDRQARAEGTSVPALIRRRLSDTENRQPESRPVSSEP